MNKFERIEYQEPKQFSPNQIIPYYSDILDNKFNRLINESVSLDRLQNHRECSDEWSELIDSQFMSLDKTESVYAFSAYLDEYLEESLFVIRVFIYKDTKDSRTIYGTFGNTTKVESYDLTRSRAGLHELNTYRPESWRGYLATFSIDRESLDGRTPCVVGVSVGASPPIALPIRRTKMKEKMYKNTLCIAPLYNVDRFSPSRILEYLTMLSRVGIERAVVYLGADVPWFWKEIFTNNYTSDIKVEFVKWYLPNPKIFRLGQELMTNECLFREMASSKYLSFFDLDEMIVPAAKYDSVNSALDDYFVRYPSTDFACFYNVYYPTYFIGNKNQTRNVYFMYEIRRKCDYLNAVETKCIIRPERIRQMAVHQPILYLTGSWVWRDVSETENFAICRHYTAPHKKYCNIHDENQIVKDNSIEKFLRPMDLQIINHKISELTNVMMRYATKIII